MLKRLLLTIGCLLIVNPHAFAVPSKLGDLDEDGVPTVADLSRILRHISGAAPLADSLKPFADLNGDRVVNDLDLEELTKEILGTRTPQTLPLGNISRISPEPFEDNVALTREIVLEFSIPLSLDSILTPEKIGVVFADRQVLSRVELSFDRKKVSLFTLENLPSSAQLQVLFDTGGLTDLLGRPIDGDLDGVGGGIFASTFSTGTVSGVAGTAITGVVYASERATGGSDVPLAGVTIAVDGAEETLRTVTNAQGQFTLNPCPAGRFFVTIDGRTSPASQFPAGDYFPVVGKKWDAAAGRINNLSGNSEDTSRGKIYLPRIKAGTLQPVSSSAETLVALPASLLAQHPEWAAVELRVPANSLFSDSGARGGSVGIAPVAPDRLPSPLPLGLNMPLVLTIQTDGPTNFDRPVPLSFPNLPDPTTGIKLSAGSKSALWSFNHDTGEWEVVGPMTVSADGLTVNTDAGVGVRQPGWHGPNPATPGRGGPPSAPPPPYVGDPSDPPPFANPPNFPPRRAGPNPPVVPRPRPTAPPPPGDPPAPPPVEPENEKPEEPEPCKYRAAYITPLIFDLGQKGFECVAEIIPVKNGVKCMVSLISVLGDASKFVAKMSLLKESKTPSISFVQAELDYLKGLIKQLDGLEACIKLADPAKKGGDMLVCLDAALTVFKDVCDVINDPLLPPHCQVSFLVKRMCLGIAVLQDLVAQVRAIVKEVNRMKDKLISGVLRLALASVETELSLILIDLKAQQLNGIRDGHPLPQPNLANLEAALALVEAELNEISPAASGSMEFESLTDAIVSQAAGIFADAAKSLSIDGEPSSAPLFFAIDVAGQVVRGRSDESGSIRAILPPNEYVTVRVWQPSSHQYAETPTLTAGAGQQTVINAAMFMGPESGTMDQDGDGLPDVAERVVGTRLDQKDSDADGVNDQDELVQGTNPLDNTPMQTGVIAVSPTAGPAVDVAAGNGLLVVAEGGYGFEIFRSQPGGRQPLRVAAFPLTNDDCQSAAVNDDYVAVAASTGLLYLRAPTVGLPGSRPTRVNVGGRARCVALDAGTAFVGTQEGHLVEVDLNTGAVLGTLGVAASVDDIVINGGVLYLYRQGWSIAAVPLATRPLAISGSVGLSGGTYAGRRNRLSAAGPLLYAQHIKGWHIIGLTNPNQPTVIENFATAQFGWRHVVPNGSGLGLVITGPNTSNDAPHDFGIYNVGDDGKGHTAGPFLGLNLHGEALAIFNGQAYMAAGTSGLQVINYRAFEQTGSAPTIALTANFPLTGGSFEEGRLLRLFAAVTDDVQVRSVEFLVDGVQVSLDGAYPFETAVNAPDRTATKTNFTVQAIARDTGGHETASPVYTLQLVADATPPTVVRSSPVAASLSQTVSTALISFNEAMGSASLTGTSVYVESAGLDGVFGNADDNKPAQALYSSSETEFFVSFANPLPSGLYRTVAKAPAADASGNAMAAAYLNQWRVASDKDTDGDLIPDDWETRYGFNPAVADANSNTIPDGNDDNDGDGVINRIEVLFGFDPTKTDTNNNGIPDGSEDSDADGLGDAAEFLAGTDPFDPDSDDDGFLDEAEVTGGSNPLLASSVPWFRPGAVVGRDVKNILRIATNGAEMAFGVVTIAQETGALKLNTSGAAFPLGSVHAEQGDPNVHRMHDSLMNFPLGVIRPQVWEVNLHRLDDPVTKQQPFGTPTSVPRVRVNSRQP